MASESLDCKAFLLEQLFVAAYNLEAYLELEFLVELGLDNLGELEGEEEVEEASDYQLHMGYMLAIGYYQFPSVFSY